MARASAISFLFFLICSIASPQAFGRFGYSIAPAIPGFMVDKNGFTAKYGASEKFYFAEPARKWNVTHVSDVGEDIDLGSGAGPSTLEVNLYAPGFMLRFPKGFALKLGSTSPPFLSWNEASVGEHVPTPGVRWIGVSFKQSQPPVVLGFLDDEVSLQIDGQLGDWTLRTLKPYTGWVRVALPVGTRPMATTSAATLGKLSIGLAASNELWWQQAPNLKSLTVDDQDTAIEATWHFDRRGAVIPVGATMANLGSYPLAIETKTRRLEGSTEEGPITVSEEQTVTIRFPIKRIPLGRAVTVGAPVLEPLGTVSAYDVAGVVELAFENLVAARDLRSRTTAQEVVDELIQGVQYVTEPHTNQQLPFAADGKGIDVDAANALLYQAYTMSTKPSSLDNALLTSVGWRRDWYTWKVWTDDQKVSRRAGALAAMAGALCSEPERRLDAAMAQAGLAAERGLGIYLMRLAGSGTEPTLLEPIWDLRNTIFGMTQTPRHPSAFAASLLGDVRIFGDTPVRCSGDTQRGFEVEWVDPSSITLASSFPLLVRGAGVIGHHVMGYTNISSRFVGAHAANVALPPWSKPLPAFVAPPRYDEPIN